MAIDINVPDLYSSAPGSSYPDYKEAVRFTLAGRDGMRSTVMTLNGRDLVLGEHNELPALSGEPVSGKIELAPGTCTFIVM